MAELSPKAIAQFDPRVGSTLLCYVSGTSAQNNDTLTVTTLTTVKGAFLIASDGTVGTMTFATNVITVTNGGTKVWSGLAWGT